MKYLVTLLIFYPLFLTGQNVFTVYDYAHEVRFEIYDPISPKRLETITDSLINQYDCTLAQSGCKWVEDYSLNGGHSDCSVRQTTIYKNPPNMRKRILNDWLTGYSDTVNYCRLDLSDFEVQGFEKRGFVMVDTCNDRFNTYTGSLSLDSYPNLSKIAKDTVWVQVLCIEYSPASDINFRSTDGTVKAKYKQMERAFEMQNVPIYAGTKAVVYPANFYETKLVQVASRYLDPVDGCFQLIPLNK